MNEKVYLRAALVFCCAALVTLMAGCASDPKYACGVPETNGRCRSVSEVAAEDDPPMRIAGTNRSDRAPAPPAPPTPQVSAPRPILASPGPGSAILSRPRILRALVLPWQDKDGDLNAGGYVYLRLDDGEWTIGK